MDVPVVESVLELAVRRLNRAVLAEDFDLRAGRQAVERMKELAQAGQGLNTFINQGYRQKFARKLK